MLTAADAATMSLCVQRKNNVNKRAEGVARYREDEGRATTRQTQPQKGVRKNKVGKVVMPGRIEGLNRIQVGHTKQNKKTAVRWFQSILGAGSFRKSFRFASKLRNTPFRY